MNTATTCHDTLRLAEQLIARPSVTPNDEGCLDLIAEGIQVYIGLPTLTCRSSFILHAIGRYQI